VGLEIGKRVRVGTESLSYTKRKGASSFGKDDTKLFVYACRSSFNRAQDKNVEFDFYGIYATCTHSDITNHTSCPHPSTPANHSKHFLFCSL
jgi:hypothetical protein